MAVQVAAHAAVDDNDQEMPEMKTLMNKFSMFLQEEDGLTTVEYAVAGTLVALAVVVAFTQLGNAVGNSINKIENVLEP